MFILKSTEKKRESVRVMKKVKKVQHVKMVEAGSNPNKFRKGCFVCGGNRKQYFAQEAANIWN